MPGSKRDAGRNAEDVMQEALVEAWERSGGQAPPIRACRGHDPPEGDHLARSSDRRARRQARADSIHQEPAFAERVSRWFAEWWWLPAGATTVVVGGLILSLRAAPSVSTVANLAPQPVRHVYTPEQVDNYLVEARDLGVFVGSDNRPYKLVRATWVDEADYRAADGNSRMLVTDAREQLVPVALEVY